MSSKHSLELSVDMINELISPDAFQGKESLFRCAEKALVSGGVVRIYEEPTNAPRTLVTEITLVEELKAWETRVNRFVFNLE